ncbi:MAG: DNA-3-methyladenine glycosylase [Acidimicrobiia bacterium]|nr:DNA-3-methyladenine glycosylase [Acidimicrobiia bacterium]
MTLPDLGRHALEVAPDLLGARLISDAGGIRTEVRLREVEAYGGPEDPASHAAGGPTPRCETMFARPGTLYVYLSYGVHWLANVVTGAEGEGQAVLLRGGLPVEGVEAMEARRGRSGHLTDGPGKLGAAMAIGPQHNGLDLLDPNSEIRLEPGPLPASYRTTKRIGITRAVDYPWRFLASPAAMRTDSDSK